MDKPVKSYFVLTNQNELQFLGKFSCFSDAWEYADYEETSPFVWIFKEENLRKLRERIDEVVVT